MYNSSLHVSAMTIQGELKPEIVAKLREEARLQGVPLEKAAERLLQQALASRTEALSLSVQEFHAMLKSLATGSESLPNLPTDGFTRESFYEGRAWMAAEPCLLDTNILLRWVKPDDQDYPLSVSAIEKILRQGSALGYTSQNVAEFWNTCTRPLERNGYGLSPQDADRRAKLFEEKLRLLSDSVAVHEE